MPTAQIAIPAGTYMVTIDGENDLITVPVAIGTAPGNAEPGPVLIVDGQSVDDLNLPYLDVSYWQSQRPDATLSLTADVTRDPVDDPTPSSLAELQEQNDDLRLDIVVSDGIGEARYSVDFRVYPVATMALPGLEAATFHKDSGVQSIPLTALFGPAVANPNWSATNLTYVLLNAPAGVSLAAGSVQIDTDILAVQSGRSVSVRASDVVTVDGVNTTRNVMATLTFDIIENVISLALQPRVGDAQTQQLFCGERVADFSNRALIMEDDPDAWSGLGTPGTRIFRTRRNGGPSEVTTLVAGDGDVIRPIADGYVGGRGPADGSPDATFFGTDVTVQRYLDFQVDAEGRLLTLQVNPNVPADRELARLEINNQPVLPGLVPADFALTDQMKQLTAPLIGFAEQGGLGDALVYTPPAIIAPTGMEVSWSFDLIDAGDQSVVLADQILSGNMIEQEVTVAQQGKTLFWRAKARSVGLPDLVIDSPAVTIPAASAVYTPTLVTTTGTAYSVFPMPSGIRYMTGFAAFRGAPSYIFRQGNAHFTMRVINGAIRVTGQDSNNLEVFDGQTSSGVVDPGALHGLLVHVDMGNGVDAPPMMQAWLDGDALSFTWATAPGTVLGSGEMRDTDMALGARWSGADASDFDLADPLIHLGALLPASTFFEGNGALKGSGVIANHYQQGQGQSAADYNAGTNLVSGGVAVTVGSATYGDV